MRRLLQATVAGASLLAMLACGGGGGGTTTPPAPPAAPVITNFTAAKSPITAGTSTTLTAAFSNGNGSIDHGLGAVTSGQAVAASPTSTTTYLLTVTNSAGTSVTQTATVAVVAAPVAQIASTIPADAALTAGAAGFQAEVPDQPGCTYAWTLSGGTLDAGAGTRAVRFSAGAAGTLSLSVTVTNAAGTAQQGTWSRPVLAPPPGVTLTAPTEASVDTLDLSASVTPVAGASYQWAISGGTITAGADSSTVSFASGPAAAASGATVAAPACGTLILTLTLKLPDGRTFLFSIVIPLACDPNAVPSVPATANTGQSGLAGSVHEQRNCTYTWAVNGGTLTAGQGTHRITFSAGAPGTMTVQCTVRNSSAVSKTGIATVTVLPAGTPTIQYTPAVYVLTRGVSAPAIAPTVSGGSITTWAIAPTLPAGLAFSTLTGAISGTPTALSPATTYSVNGAYPGGTATTTLSLAVQDAPTGISYPGSPYTLTRGQSIGAIAPVVNGGTPTAWAIVPTLPTGLAFSATTGIISGQTSTLSAATVYTVSATHSGGTFTTDLTLAVVDLAPGIRYTPSHFVFTKGTAIDLITPTNLGGAADSWTIAPALPTGLSFNTASGQISGTPTVLSTATEYTVTARNSGGPGTTNLTITVNDVRPAIAYGASSYAFTKGEPITPLTPTNTGGAVVTWSVNPTLPSGLTFGTSSGVIAGTPNAVTNAAAYTIQGTNSGGTFTASLSIAIYPPPDATIVPGGTPLPPYLTVGTTTAFASVAIQPGCNYSWSILDGNLTGSHLTNPTNSTVGLNVGGTPGTLKLQCVVVNGSGTSAVGTFDFIIVAAPTITTFYATPNPVEKGATVTFQASFDGGSGIITPAVGVIISNGTASLANFTKTETFTLSVTNASGNITTRTVLVSIGQTFALPGNVALAMVSIPSGMFTMGSPDTEVGRRADEGPLHQVAVGAFQIGMYEVSQAQWLSVMGMNPSRFSLVGGGATSDDLSRPVERVSWEDITRPITGFLAKLNEHTTNTRPTGYTFRLPTEAEWEYAARAGTSTRFYWGDDISHADIKKYAWYFDNSNDTTHPVGTKLPNEWGLFDTIGNVAEWCQDFYGAYSSIPQTDAAGPSSGLSRVIRSGGWNINPNPWGSACRASNPSTIQESYLGLRVVLAPPLMPGSLTFPISDASNPAAITRLVVNPIPAGTFTMGSPESEVGRQSEEGPLHQVTISRSFYMGMFEVTQEQWSFLMGSNPSHFLGDLTRPVEQVNDTDITEPDGFLERLNSVTAVTRPTGMVFRLPTEAEWEYSCRAGTTTRFYWGEDPNYSASSSFAWYWVDDTSCTKPVGLKIPNLWGLYDMNGNVWEWCQDRYSLYTSADQIDPTGASGTGYRVDRGGSWNYGRSFSRSAARFSGLISYAPDRRNPGLGFRVVLASPTSP